MDSAEHVGGAPQTVGDSTRYDYQGLPTDLQHPRIYGYRDVGSSLGEAYQILFEDSWMPFDYEIPDGWELQYARAEWEPHHSLPWILRKLWPGKARVCIVVAEAELNHGFC